ncbi:MAG: cell division protein FtsQ/DivIB [Paludibacteraceae bacterium]|nr:cell division protein FtsQ/DivIB [Paludibacteraceae bacterium]
MKPRTKQILLTICTVTCITVFVGYCIFSIAYFCQDKELVVCANVEVCIEDSASYQFVQQADVYQYMHKKHIAPIGKPIGINQCHQIEKTLSQMTQIKQVECYMGYDSTLYIQLWQRYPIFRVMPAVGKSYYIDRDQKKMPTTANFTAYLPVVSGYVSLQEAQTEVFDFVQYLLNDNLWKSMIAEIHVSKDKQFTLVSRQGIPYIELGSLQDYPQKLKKLRAWYQQYPHKNDSNIYKKITITYDQLIFCAK